MPRKLKGTTKISADAASSFFAEVEMYLLCPDEPPSEAARQYVASILRALALTKKDHQAVFKKAANINYRSQRASDFDVLHKAWGIVARGEAKISEATRIAARELHIDERNARHALSKSLEYLSETGERVRHKIVKPNQLRVERTKQANKKKRVPKAK